MKINNRLTELEANAPDQLPYPLNYLKGKISDEDFQFIKNSGIEFKDVMFIDSVPNDVKRYRMICTDAGLLPPLNFGS